MEEHTMHKSQHVGSPNLLLLLLLLLAGCM
jgi:hypothetical protein